MIDSFEVPVYTCKSKKPWKIYSDDFIKTLYNTGVSAIHISIIAQLSHSAVLSHLKKMGVPMRYGCVKYYEVSKTKIALSKMGEKNPHWAGDTPKDPKNTGYQRAWRMYETIEGLQKHHIDGNPLNNDPSNIQYLPRKEHVKLHSQKRKLSLESIKKTAKPIVGAVGEEYIFTCKNHRCSGHDFYAWQNGAKFCKNCGRVQRSMRRD